MKMKPTEQANKLMKGCGNSENRYSTINNKNYRDICCGDRWGKDKKIICPSCKKAIQELKIAFEWDLIFMMTLDKCCDDLDKEKDFYCKNCRYIDERIKELKQAIKILENGK